MDEESRLRYITRHYYGLQMIRFAPVWCFLLSGVALKRLFWRDSRPLFAVVAGVLAFLFVQTAWYLLANRYYQRRFGRVQTTKASAMPRKPNSIYLAVLIAIIAWAVFDRFSSAPGRAWFPFMLALLLAGPSFAADEPTWRRWTYGICGAVIGGSALLARFVHLSGETIAIIICTTMLLAAVSDHCLLVSLFSIPHGDADA